MAGTGHPSVADAGRSPDAAQGVAPHPYGRPRLLDGLGIDGHPIQREMVPLPIDIVFYPQLADHGYGFIQSAAAVSSGDPKGSKLYVPVSLSHAENELPPGHHVQGRRKLGRFHRVVQA